jgi:hypothetical protein
VVWCLPPNIRPISGSEACINSFTMYMAICRGKAICRALVFCFRLGGLQPEVLGHLPQMVSMVNALRSGSLAEVLQNLLRHGKVDG